MKLTKRNYFTTKNTCLSNSRLGDWFKDKQYFYKRHITGKIEKAETPALRLGKAVDTYVFDGPSKFAKKYVMVARRSKEPPKGVTELPTAEYQQVIEMGQKVRAQKAMKYVLKWYKTQVILQTDMDLGHFTGMCGIPDAIYVDEKKKKAIIFDLKTARTIDPVKYHFHCETYNYYQQCAFYSMLMEVKYDVEKFEYLHLVVEKDGDNIFNCQTFTLANERVDMEKEKIRKALGEIKRETKFLPNNISWADAITIGTKPVKSEEGWGDGVEI